MKIKKEILEWNIVEIASAFKISINEVKEYFSDSKNLLFVLKKDCQRKFLAERLPNQKAQISI